MESQEKDNLVSSLHESKAQLRDDLSARDKELGDLVDKLAKEQGHRVKLSELYDGMEEMYNKSKEKEEELLVGIRILLVFSLVKFDIKPPQAG